MTDFHPELKLARFLPRFKSRMWSTKLQQRLTLPGAKAPDDVSIETVTITGPGGPLRLKIFSPRSAAAATTPAPALFWLHGGGYIGGSPEQDDGRNIEFARRLGMVVVAGTYRLSPGARHPAAVEDAYAGLLWVFEHADGLGVDTARIAIGGASAGAGLAAGLALYAHDKGEVTPVFQLLVYPMLDDRTVLRPDIDSTNMRAWIPQNNRFGWTAYLGQEPGSPGIPDYAAPARRVDLSGLPPAWIGVGTNDLFHDEDAVYAHRLVEAGVPCEFVEVPGAFHGFDILFSKTEVARGFTELQLVALGAAVGSPVR